MAAFLPHCPLKFSGFLGQVQHGFADGNRVKEVIFEPCAQGNMPSSPILSNGLGEIWELKVFIQSNTSNCADPIAMSMPPVKSAYNSMA